MSGDVLVRLGKAEFWVRVDGAGGPGTIGLGEVLSFKAVRQTVEEIGSQLSVAWDRVKPSEAVVEVGLTLTATSGKLTGLIVDGEGEGSALYPYAVPGVYHVETPHEVAHDEFVHWLAGAGYQVTLMDDDAFQSAVSRVENDYPAARLAASLPLPGLSGQALPRPRTGRPRTSRSRTGRS